MRTQVDPAAIANCTLCDTDGYRNLVVCDHIDHTETNQRGLAKCREVLAHIAAKKGQQP